jgi:outer membrane receptor protein involved in Fe transport
MKVSVARSTLFANTVLCGLFGLTVLAAAGAASAQDAPPPADPQVDPQTEGQAEDQEATTLGEVIVTGTRLRIPDYEGSNPVASVSGETLVNAGVTNVTDFLTDQPALVGSTTLQDNSNAADRGSVGINLLNLRNLGEQRTLVLVNGRRHVAGQSGSASVDINTIPVALVERIDVLTGGASAIYGADGVSGVVNFILKDDFQGLDLRAQTGWSENGGGANNFVSVLAGRNFLDGRANFTLGGEFSKTGRLGREDRAFSAVATSETLTGNPAYDPANPQPGVYQEDFFRDARYIDSSRGGSVYTDFDFGDSFSGVDFTGVGDPWTDGVYSEGFVMLGGDGTRLAEYQTDLIPELQRGVINSTFNVEITPKATFFGEFKWVNTQTQFLSQPSFDFGLFIPIDNPYMPAAIRADATAFNGLAEPGFGLDGVIMVRDNFDLGYITRDVERNTYRGVIGLRGDLTDHLSYEASLNYGRTSEENTESANRINERFYAAIDAVDEGEFLTGTANGNIVCRSDLDPTAAPIGNFPGFGSTPFDPATWGSTFTPGPNSGCRPLNVFGDGAGDPAARDWILEDAVTHNRVEQFVFNAFLSGDTGEWFNLPGGPVSFAFGVEYRKEKARSLPSIRELQGAQTGYDITWLGQTTPLVGEFDVKEAFVEASLPLLADLPFVQTLTLDTAYRYSDYSTAGQTDSWKAGLRWDVNDAVGLRSSYGQSVRAPNISELFLPTSQTFAILDDPCDDDNYQAGINPDVREANCRAALGLGPADPYTFNNTSSSSIEGVIGGNPGLEPEEGKTFTAGIVLTPPFLHGLSFSLDYYDIKLENAIQFFSAQSIVDKCYDLPQPNQFCGLITRDPGNDFIDSFQQFGVNVAEYTTSGYDMSLRYALDPADWGVTQDIGRFSLVLNANKLEDLTFTEDPSDPLSSDETVGQAFVPEWQATLDLNWQWKNLFVNYGYNWFAKTRRFEGRPDDYVDPRYKDYSERSTHDIQARYTLNDRASVYGGINNFTDQQPDRGQIAYPVSPMGRFFYLGLNMTL